MDKINTDLYKIIEFEQMFLKDNLRFTPVKMFVEIQYDEVMLKDLYEYFDAALSVLNKYKHPLNNKAIKLASSELDISLNKEWEHPPLLFIQYRILNQRLKDVLGLDIEKNKYFILSVFIVTLISRVKEKRL
jgi:hypothetical protein